MLVNVSILGIPPLVLWLFVHWLYPASIDPPVTALVSLAVAAPLMAPGVRREFS